MISYHPDSLTKPVGTTFTYGFELMPWMNAEHIARIAAKYAWSPIIWKGGQRHSKNFQESHWIGLDFDCSELSLADAVNNFCDMIHVIGTTRNHQVLKDGVAGDRFRVILKWDKPIKEHDLYKYNIKKLIKKYDADKACSDTGRHFFPCKEIVSVSAEGYYVDVEPIDHEAEERRRIEQAARYRAGVLSPTSQMLLRSTWEQGTKNTNCFRLGCDFARCGVSYEDAVARILESPEYVHRKIAPDLYEEIASAVLNGFKAEEKKIPNP